MLNKDALFRGGPLLPLLGLGLLALAQMLPARAGIPTNHPCR